MAYVTQDSSDRGAGLTPLVDRNHGLFCHCGTHGSACMQYGETRSTSRWARAMREHALFLLRGPGRARRARRLRARRLK
eukprot:5595559-Pyramimonas_sp.AAC.1